MSAIVRLWALALAALAVGLFILAMPHHPWVRAGVGAAFLGLGAAALGDAAIVAVRKRRRQP